MQAKTKLLIFFGIILGLFLIFILTLIIINLITPDAKNTTGTVPLNTISGDNVNIPANMAYNKSKYEECIEYRNRTSSIKNTNPGELIISFKDDVSLEEINAFLEKINSEQRVDDTKNLSPFLVPVGEEIEIMCKIKATENPIIRMVGPNY